ncbi:MAG: Na/Pi cotransporter family protein, partial [Candidatus Aminicenantes bacterium]
MRLPRALRVLILIGAVYTFLLCINLLGSSLKLLGGGFASQLINATSNPLVGLFIGILSTSLVQSSSFTTAMVVTLVGTGSLSIVNAIPIIMGANIGTTVTNTLVSLAHITRKREFGQAFSAAIVHDFFNILCVIVFFPLEIYFHIVEKISYFLARTFEGAGGLKMTSPLKIILEPASRLVEGSLAHKPLILFLFSLILLFSALTVLVAMTRSLMSKKAELFLDKYLFGTAGKSFLLGLLLTAVIQSSSVTTSLVVPLVGAGLLTLGKIYPYVLGANIGTVVTAILASWVTGSFAGAQAAFAHLSFNVLGICLWYPLRGVPLGLTEGFSSFIKGKRFLALIYLIFGFFLLPLFLILL